MEILQYIATAILAYLLGSIPTGFLVARSRGIDIRTVGSGNIGATNAFRMLGKPAGTLVLLGDALKGFIACTGISFASEVSGQEFHAMVAGLFVILGHNYTCWLKFKGGKGIATTAGVLLALVPLGLLLALAVWLITFVLSRYVSLASIATALCLPFAVWLTRSSPSLVLLMAIFSSLAIYKHRANIQRLLNGTEHRFGAKKTPSPTESPS